jgi:hypothetical protein
MGVEIHQGQVDLVRSSHTHTQATLGPTLDLDLWTYLDLLWGGVHGTPVDVTLWCLRAKEVVGAEAP